MLDFNSLRVWLDVVLILLPLLVAAILVYKLVLPKHAKLGLGILAGMSALGAFLVHRKLKKAFAVEDKLAEFNEDYARFKEIQKRRQQAVTANQQVIKVLEERRQKLSKEAEKYKTELQLIDAELKDRLALNEKLINDAASFVASAKERSERRKKLLSSDLPPKKEAPGDEKKDIEIDGYRLIEE